MKLILLGAPGAGKGTQAEIISKRLSIPIVSTGNILKNAVRRGTDLGKQAEEYLSSGRLVPDDLIIGILKQTLSDEKYDGGFILDGVPRTVAQAKALKEMDIVVDCVLSIEVPDDIIQERLTGRRICSLCGSSYHITNKKPAKEGICDNCGGQLIIRDDDIHETVIKRLRIYHETTEQLKDFYEREGLLRIIDGRQNVADTTRSVMAAIEG